MLQLRPPLEILRPAPRVLRQFGAAAAVVTLALGLGQRESSLALGVCLGLSLVASLLALAAPRALRVPFLLLTYVTYPLGVLAQGLLALVFYFLVFTPFALSLRALRRVAKRRASADANAEGGWRSCPPAAPSEQYFRPY